MKVKLIENNVNVEAKIGDLIVTNKTNYLVVGDTNLMQRYNHLSKYRLLDLTTNELDDTIFNSKIHLNSAIKDLDVVKIVPASKLELLEISKEKHFVSNHWLRLIVRRTNEQIWKHKMFHWWI